VDFDPLGLHDIRLLLLIADSLSGPITAAIGSYSNTANTLTYSWLATQDVLIVASTPGTIPGGVAPHINVGPSWLERSYSFAALVAANPTAVLLDEWPNDGGMPAGVSLPAIVICSGDSGNITKSGKRIHAVVVNGSPVVPV